MAKFLIEVDTSKEAVGGTIKVNGTEISNVFSATIYFYRDNEGAIQGAEVQVVASERVDDNMFVETRYYSSATEDKKEGEEIQPGVFKTNELDLVKQGIKELFL